MGNDVTLILSPFSWSPFLLLSTLSRECCTKSHMISAACIVLYAAPPPPWDPAMGCKRIQSDDSGAAPEGGGRVSAVWAPARPYRGPATPLVVTHVVPCCVSHPASTLICAADSSGYVGYLDETERSLMASQKYTSWQTINSIRPDLSVVTRTAPKETAADGGKRRRIRREIVGKIQASMKQ
ncbi:hypothetical protein LX32DRAFT_710265 [Colletotrichum zoysiae]|uniref:Uncharacterized protein n=1 Tax=Colletotrichum zoysiae TaxID=1216348 RepID=A0AAD9LXZ1_9PEZI|nr:hypothetical protein LX32DRAFT_710265 [Colletotrichum zoysiae]